MKMTTEKRRKISRKGNTTKHDSVFVTEHFEPETFDETVELQSFDAFIERTDKTAEQMLVDAKLWPHPNRELDRLIAAIETSKKAPDDSPEYFSACVIWWVCNLRDAIKSNDSRAAADAGYRVADSVNKALIAKMEFPFVVGYKSIFAGSNDRNKARHAAAIERDAPLLAMATG